MIDRYENEEIINLTKDFEGYKDAESDFVSVKFDKIRKESELWVDVMGFQFKTSKSVRSAEEGIRAFWRELGNHEEEFLKALKD